MSIQDERLLVELKVALRDYANHIDFFVQQIGSKENIKIFNRYQNSSDIESICIQAMIYKACQDYGSKLIGFEGETPSVPKVLNSNALIQNTNKKGIKRFVKQNNLDLPFFALLSNANPNKQLVTSFEDRKYLQNFLHELKIRHIKKFIQLDIGLLENFEKGTWKAIRDKIKTLDSIKF